MTRAVLLPRQASVADVVDKSLDLLELGAKRLGVAKVGVPLRGLG